MGWYFLEIAFGDSRRAVKAELNRPESCLLGVDDLYPERYGEKIIDTAIKLLKGEAVAPAVFAEHEFVFRKEVQMLQRYLSI